MVVFILAAIELELEPVFLIFKPILFCFWTDIPISIHKFFIFLLKVLEFWARGLQFILKFIDCLWKWGILFRQFWVLFFQGIISLL